jgi:superoxide dismutase, Fe-Mn family
MAFELPKLPYPENALDPYISGEQMSFHYGKHHEAYVSTLNRLVKDTPLASKSVEEIVRLTANEKDESKVQIFNNSAQHWNHSFFWQCMKPNGGGAPSGALAQKIDQAFGGLDKFKEQFKQAAVTQFGSGWAWLVVDGGQLKITKTANAVNPMAQGQTALLTCDVWEHAYYLDYQNRRPDFVQTFLDKLVNWEFVASNLSKAG